MPDFLCIGAQKAGTSWLYRQLERHPQVAFPGGKEVHYWDWVQAGKRPDDIAAYRRKFQPIPDKRLGDITPAYSTLQLRYVEKVSQEFPAMRIIFMMRNPIERAWSAARMALENVQLDPDEVDDRWFLPILRSRSSIARGDYEHTLRLWSGCFPSQQILTIFYEELTDAPLEMLQRVGLHLDIDPEFFVRSTSLQLRARIRVGKDLPMPAALRDELRHIYSPRIQSLARYLDVDLSHWLH